MEKEELIPRSGRVVSINVAGRRGVPKRPADSCRIVEGFGLEGDAHGGNWHRQVSLLASESLRRMSEAGAEAYPGRYGENITTEGLDLVSIPVGTRLALGEDARLEITQVRKSEDDPTAVYYPEKGKMMPLDVVFARVIVGGTVVPGDALEVLGSE